MEEFFMQRSQKLVEEFRSFQQWEDRYKKIIQMGKNLPDLPEEFRQEKFLVKGCQSQVWLHAELDDEGKMLLKADSDALIVKGLVAVLLQVYSGLTPKEVLASSPQFMEDLGFKESLSPSRANGFVSMIKQIMLYAQAFSLTQASK